MCVCDMYVCVYMYTAGNPPPTKQIHHSPPPPPLNSPHTPPTHSGGYIGFHTHKLTPLPPQIHPTPTAAATAASTTSTAGPSS